MIWGWIIDYCWCVGDQGRQTLTAVVCQAVQCAVMNG